MTSLVNPEATGLRFQKVLVHGAFWSLGHQKLAEDQICENLVYHTDRECLKSYEVFFPGEDYTAEQIRRKLAALDIDGVLALKPTGAGESSTYLSQMSHTTTTATVIGNAVHGSSTTVTSGGNRLVTQWANYEVFMLSTIDDKIAWYATAASKGNALLGWDDLIWSASRKTVRKLISDGVFRNPSE